MSLYKAFHVGLLPVGETLKASASGIYRRIECLRSMLYKKKNLIIIILFFLLPQLLFINKAINIDDVPFLAIAHHISYDPLHPYSFNFNLSDIAGPAYEIATAPLIMYYLAAVTKLFGEKETILHFAILPFSLLSLYCIYQISKFFTKKPLITTLLVATAPSLFVSATTLMMDIPFLAFSLLTILLFLKSIKTPPEHETNHWVILTGLTAGLTTLIKYTAIVPITIVAFGFLLKRRYSSLLVYLILAGIIALLWQLYFYYLYGVFHPVYVRSLSTAGYVLNLNYTIKQLTTPTFLSFLGGTTLFITPLLFLSKSTETTKQNITNPAGKKHGDLCLTILNNSIIPYYSRKFGRVTQTLRKKCGMDSAKNSQKSKPMGIRKTQVTTLILSGIYLFVVLALAEYSLPQSPANQVLFIIFVANGAILLIFTLIYIISSLLKGKRHWQNWFLAVWLILSLTIPLLFNPFLAVRFISFPLVPLAIIVSKNLKKSFIIWPFLVITLWVSLMIAVGDSRWANIIRSFVQRPDEIITKKDANTHYLGHWAIQYYVEKQGKNSFDLARTKLKKGDLIVQPVNIPSQSQPDLSKSKRLAKIPLYHHWPIVTMYWPARAGWYSHRWGNMPYILYTGPVETITVWAYIPR